MARPSRNVGRNLVLGEMLPICNCSSTIDLDASTTNISNRNCKTILGELCRLDIQKARGGKGWVGEGRS